MQAFFVTPREAPYNAGMKTGRPSKYPRSPFGERLHAAREAAGLSQAQVAAKLSITQTAYAVGSASGCAAPRSDRAGRRYSRRHGRTAFRGDGKAARQRPAGKLRQVFERASQLPREQQKHVVRAVEDAIAGYQMRQAS